MLRSRIGGVMLGAALLVTPQWLPNAMAAPSPVRDADERPDPLGRGLVVRVADDVPDTELIHQWIEQRGRDVLGERRATLEARDLIRVAVRGAPYDYRITLQVRRRGKDLPEQPEPLICECGSEEMLARVGEAIDVAADRLTVVAAQERRAEDSVASADAVSSFKVWIEPSVSDAESIQKWIEDQARKVLSERARRLGAEDLIHVTLRGGPYEYRVHIALLRHKRLLEEQPAVIECDCKTDDMLAQVAEGIAEGAERLDQAVEAERVAREEVERPWVPGSGIDSSNDRRARRTLRPLGQVGIGVGVLGVGLIAVGVPLAVRPEPARLVDSEVQRLYTRQPGIGLSVTGGVALAAGISMLIADLARQRESVVNVAPAVAPQQTGVWIRGRF
jgi:hypothetical protein